MDPETFARCIEHFTTLVNGLDTKQLYQLEDVILTETRRREDVQAMTAAVVNAIEAKLAKV